MTQAEELEATACPSCGARTLRFDAPRTAKCADCEARWGVVQDASAPVHRGLTLCLVPYTDPQS